MGEWVTLDTHHGPVRAWQATPALLLEMHYRAQPYRDTDALTGFMDGAERSVLMHLGAVPRIRCFAVDAAGLSARH